MTVSNQTKVALEIKGMTGNLKCIYSSLLSMEEDLVCLAKV